ncbi:hypothetical protein L8T67_02790 [Campylobacter lari]|uniref:hypothetical protein n=1 Tax=Campylobacter lari TaxID=201 RepID=UPI0021E6B0CE|nr:hypothetical protein [Campylobacter lari]MCV3395938.1 hypothetical protein [Campylobacter lari]MCV3414520.1 hypothetical protein [Campylobacter lari]
MYFLASSALSPRSCAVENSLKTFAVLVSSISLLKPLSALNKKIPFSLIGAFEALKFEFLIIAVPVI